MFSYGLAAPMVHRRLVGVGPKPSNTSWAVGASSRPRLRGHAHGFEANVSVLVTLRSGSPVVGPPSGAAGSGYCEPQLRQ